MSDVEERAILNGLSHDHDQEWAFVAPVLNIYSELLESYWNRDSNGLRAGRPWFDSQQ
jgi:hypothetical protein